MNGELSGQEEELWEGSREIQKRAELCNMSRWPARDKLENSSWLLPFAFLLLIYVLERDGWRGRERDLQGALPLAGSLPKFLGWLGLHRGEAEPETPSQSPVWVAWAHHGCPPWAA